MNLRLVRVTRGFLKLEKLEGDKWVHIPFEKIPVINEEETTGENNDETGD